MTPLYKKENFAIPLALPGGEEVLLGMVFVQGGTFRMGSEENEPDAYDWEKPAHKVNLPDFFIGKFPVTQALWKAVMKGENPSVFQSDERPVESVSWNDITGAFLPALKKITGLDFRLPTEAEWEYAARGGRNCQYAGSDKLQEVGWYSANSHSETKPVGLKYPNKLGLYDMCGNVWEWCEDDWHDNYQGAPEDGSAWVNSPERGGYRVLRGGSYWYVAQYCRVAYRFNYPPAARNGDIGLRLAASFQLTDKAGWPSLNRCLTCLSEFSEGEVAFLDA